MCDCVYVYTFVCVFMCDCVYVCMQACVLGDLLCGNYSYIQKSGCIAM